MKTHFDHLEEMVPGLSHMSILDVGFGSGGFLVNAAKQGARMSGIELTEYYYQETLRRLHDAGLSADVRKGVAEKLPFADGAFDFLNIGEVYEHVEDPDQILREAFRVLREGGKAYLSVPNRYGLVDPHYKVTFVNWIPRAYAHAFLHLVRREKNLDGILAGHQRLDEMHYSTFAKMKVVLLRAGFTVEDIREKKIMQRFTFLPFRYMALYAYLPLRTLYFDSFH